MASEELSRASKGTGTVHEVFVDVALL